MDLAEGDASNRALGLPCIHLRQRNRVTPSCRIDNQTPHVSLRREPGINLWPDANSTFRSPRGLARRLNAALNDQDQPAVMAARLHKAEIYSHALCVQNVACPQYPSNKQGSNAARDRFLWDTYTPRDRSDHVAARRRHRRTSDRWSYLDGLGDSTSSKHNE